MKGRPEQLGKAAVFAAVVRAGSFSAGAKSMGLARSTASEHVAALEAALGVRLLERTTRTLRLTEEGELLFERIDHAMQAWEQARTALEERSGEPVGTLRITMPGGLATSLVASVCGEMVNAYERLDVELLIDDRVRDLVSERIDIAIRMAPLQDSSLVCRKLGSSTIVLVGSPELVAPQPPDAARPSPERELEAIAALPWITHGATHSPSVNLFDEQGQVHSLRPRYRAGGSNTEGQMSLAVSGCGLALMPELLVRSELLSGRLVRHFSRWRGRELPIYAVYSRSSFTPSRVVRFLELVTQQLDTLS